MFRIVAASAALACLGIAVACSEDETQFQVRFAPDFAKSQARVSILGVFRDGRMNAETWDELGPRLSAPFGGSANASCPIGFDKGFFSAKEHRAVGLVAMQYTGSNGPEALAKFVAKIREALPAATCTGWHWDVKVDPKAIEDLKDKEE